MNFMELKIAFNNMGYELYKSRDYRGAGYFVDDGTTVLYAGSTIREVNIMYTKLRGNIL